MYEMGAGFTVTTKKPLNESIFYDYQIDKTPLKVQKWEGNAVPLDKFIRENTGYTAVQDLVGGADDKVKLIGVGLIVLIIINIFKR